MQAGSGRTAPLLVAITVGAVIAGLQPTLGGADTAPRLRNATDALRARESKLAQREQAVTLDLYALESRLSRARAQVDELRARSSAVDAQRRHAARQADAVRRSVHVAQARIGRILRDLYVHGRPDPIAIVLGASSIDDALSGLDGFRRAARQNRRLLAQLGETRGRLARLTAQLATRARELELLRATAEHAAANLESAATDRLRTLASLRASGDFTRTKLRSLEQRARQAERRSEQLAAAARPASAVGGGAAAATNFGKPTAVSPAPSPPAASPPAAPPPATTSPPPTAPPPDTSPPPPPETAVTLRGTYTLAVDAVAYHLPGHTASGLPVGFGVVAVDPTVIPLGTRLYIPGYGPGVAADVGSAIKGNIIDLWMPSTAQARAWGRRTVTITVYG